jgi:aryl-alcohol dehydrogenase-like predicted oxidoreductase
MFDRIILGSAAITDLSRREEAFKLLDRFFALGGKTVDTAAVYGEPVTPSARSGELLLGEYLERVGRKNVTVCTKGCHPPLDDTAHSRVTAKCITEDVENSLKNLKTDYIDIWLLHRDHPDADAAEVIETLNRYIRAGAVRAIGASNWTGKRIAEANAYAAKKGLTGFSASQINYSPLEITGEMLFGDKTIVCMNDTERKFYTETAMPVMSYSCLLNSFFRRLESDGLTERQKTYLTENNKKVIARLREKVARSGGKTTLSEAAMTEILSSPFPVSIVTGARNIVQLESVFSVEREFIV